MVTNIVHFQAGFEHVAVRWKSSALPSELFNCLTSKLINVETRERERDRERERERKFELFCWARDNDGISPR